MKYTRNTLLAALRWAMLLTGPLWLQAQTDTVFTTIRTQTSEAADQTASRYESERDRLFGMQLPSRWMLTVHRNFGQPNIISSLSAPNFQLGAEVKLSPGFSVRASGGVGIFSEQNWSNNVRSTYIELEERWYHGLAKRIRSGQQANNFSTNYVGFGQSMVWIGANVTRQAQSGLHLRYGMQRRWQKHGFFDFSVGINYEVQSPAGSSIFQLSQNLRVGLAKFERSKPTAFEGGYCTVLRCFDEERSMWKINLLGVASIYHRRSIGNIGFSTVAVSPNVAYERKLGASPLSVELAAGVSGGLALFNFGQGASTYRGVQGINAALDGEFRWYYAQRRRIAEGRSGNNLSGPFAALHAGYRYEYVNMQADNGDITSDRRGTSGHVVWGYQQRIFRRGYAQFRFGLGVSNNETAKAFDLSTYGGMNVGFAF